MSIETHVAHCCFKHGCKYGDGDWCPVKSGQKVQEFPCEFCEDDSAWLERLQSDYAQNATVEERKFLASYDPSKFPIWTMTVDMAVFSVNKFGRLSLLLIKRKNFPYKDCWALPGGFVDPGEQLSEAALRELTEEAGLSKGLSKVAQVAAVNTPGRDPRGNSLTVLFHACVHGEPEVYAGDDAVEAKWFSLWDLNHIPLAFDHRDLIHRAYLWRLQ